MTSPPTSRRASGPWPWSSATSAPGYLYLFLVLAAAVAVVGVASVTTWWALVGLVFLVRCLAPVRTVLGGAVGPALVPVLAATGMAELLWAAAVAVPLFVA